MKYLILLSIIHAFMYTVPFLILPSKKQGTTDGLKLFLPFMIIVQLLVFTWH